MLATNETATTGNSDGNQIKSKHTDFAVAHIAEEIAKQFIKFGIGNKKAKLIFDEVLKLVKLFDA
ncbi:hypothetical protein [Pelosinus sp. IPA-1]|uniref:hypothetical protein n=1 Tax=Pelosinus sp. IPA-1 TaxID=3029569 RepID=UPI0024362B6E|nr:hypothetical protein [Pelosinus sp. IPA-1]GMB00402.1 hypothetical protein PIPA1_32010 [Pelosinus sp. IPA-1]